MRLRGTTLLLVVVLTALAAVSSCAAAAGRVLAERALSPAVADADTIALVAQPGEARILDARGDERAAVPIGGGCLEPPTSIGPLGGGQLVFSCRLEHTAPYPYVIDGEVRMLDLATHAEHVPAGAAAALQAAIEEPVGFGSFEAVGTHGLLFSSSYYHSNVTVKGIDWRTGAQVADPGTDAVLDMDSPTLVTPLCAPVRRQASDSPFDPRPSFNPFAYAAPVALGAGFHGPVTLQRCGERAPRVLQPRLARRYVSELRLARGVATWRLGRLGSAPTRLRGYLIACDVLLDWELEVDEQAVPTHRALVLSQGGAFGPWRIRRLLLDGICPATRAAWTLTAVNGERSVAARPSAATLGLPTREAVATLLARHAAGAARLAVRPGTSIRLTPGRRAHTVRWRSGAGAWHRLRFGRSGWRLPALAGETLAVDVRYRRGGSARFALRLVPRF